MLQYIVYLYIETCTSILRQYSFNTACVYVYIYIHVCVYIYLHLSYVWWYQGICIAKGHCCCAICPVTERSTCHRVFLVQKLKFFCRKKLPGAKHREWGNGMVVDTFFVWEWDLIDFFGGKNYLSLGLLITINNHPIPPFPTFSTSKKSGMWPLNNWGFGKGVWKLPWISNVTWWYLSI